MQVPQDFLTEWEKNFDQGERAAIAEYCGVSEKTISKAFSGEASEELILKITNYFNEKQQRLIDALKK